MRQIQITLNLGEGKLVLCQTFVENWHLYLILHFSSSLAPWWYSCVSPLRKQMKHVQTL